MSEAGGAEAEQRRALLTLILAGSPERADEGPRLLEAPGFEPMPLAEAIAVLGDNRVQDHSALRPLVVRALGRLAWHRPERVSPEVTAAISGLHRALANEADREQRGDLDQSIAVQEPVTGDQPAAGARPVDVDQPVAVQEPVELDQRVVVDHRVVAPTLDEAYDGIRTRVPTLIEPLVTGMNQRIIDLGSTQLPREAPPPPPPPPPPPEPGGPRPVQPPPTIQEAKEAAAHDGDPTAIYEVAMAAALGVNIEMVSAPACEDHAGATDDAPNSVAVSWTTKTPIDKLAQWLDPKTWPVATNGVFFTGMALLGAKVVDDYAWSADYTETVQFSPVTPPISTDLHFEHGEDTEEFDVAIAPTTFRWSTYALANPSNPANELTDDDGLLQLRRIEYDNGEVRVEATCTKNYRFKDPSLNAYAELACDTWFGELAIMMSTNCGEGY